MAFGNGRSDFYQTMFNHKINTHKSPLCDYCHTNNAVVNYYVQTPSYYRCKSSGHYFMCSQECDDKFKREKTCNRCRYETNLIFCKQKNYSLCTNYPGQDSCYDKEIKFNQYSDGTARCNLCTHISHSYEVREINDDVKLNICNQCDKVYKDIVLWTTNFDEADEYSDNECVFCKKSVKTKSLGQAYRNDTSALHCIKRNEYYVTMCELCYDNYKLLVLS